MTKKTKNHIGLKILYFVFIVAVIGAGWLSYNEFKAEAFCREHGHDTGRYKGNGGAHYSCMDFTKYNIPE